jgi:hypothetical protein
MNGVGLKFHRTSLPAQPFDPLVPVRSLLGRAVLVSVAYGVGAQGWLCHDVSRLADLGDLAAQCVPPRCLARRSSRAVVGLSARRVS